MEGEELTRTETWLKRALNEVLRLTATMSHACSERFKLASEKAARERERGQCSAFGVVNDAFPFCCPALCFDKSDFVSESSEK